MARSDPGEGGVAMSPGRCVLLAMVLLASSAAAQAPPPLDLPSERREEVPFGGDERVAPDVVEGESLPTAPPLVFTLRSVRVEGNTVLDASAIESLVAPYLGRALGQAELEALREAVTRAYVDRGFATSGAIVPDQDLGGGELVLRIVEGRLAEIRIAGLTRLRRGHVAGRLWPDLDRPLDLELLGERLSLLQADTDVESVVAELRPGARLGESILHVRVREGRPWHARLETNNHRSPRIGPYTGRVRGGLRNLVGRGDALRGSFQASRGLWDVQLGGALPLHPRGPRLDLALRYSESEVVEAPFDALDIESDFFSAGATLTQTLYETLEDRVSLGLGFEWRRGRTRVGGEGFSFSDGVDEGEGVVAPLRLDAAWTRRERARVVALRSLVSVGLPAASATDVSGAEADAEFVSWLLQAQLAQRLEALWDSELLTRGDLQLTSSPLLPSEQFSIGGHAATRGFRENQIVRDQGVALSLEWRVPVWARPTGEPILQVAPFFDWGRAFEHRDRADRDAKTLAAAGLGLRAFPVEGARAALYWGQRITKAERPRDDKDAQDYGIHFSVSLDLR